MPGLMFRRLVVSGLASLSLSHLFAALILGSVCSIWPKFSNGDNYRGRPGERRRWVLPFLNRVSCMPLQASQIHLPPSPSVAPPHPHFSHRCVPSNVPWGVKCVVSSRRHSHRLFDVLKQILAPHRSVFTHVVYRPYHKQDEEDQIL